jgi:Zinc finger, C3HC4 type (RING finger)
LQYIRINIKIIFIQYKYNSNYLELLKHISSKLTMAYHEPFTLIFKIVRTDISRQFQVDLSWSMEEFILHMKEKILCEFYLDNVDLVDDINRIYDIAAEDGLAIQPSNINIRQHYKDKINQVAFYVRPKTISPVESYVINIEPSYYACVVCLFQERNVIFSPCNHICVCSTCSSNSSITTCPICRANIVKKQDVYL